jgi:hypothetical protein
MNAINPFSDPEFKKSILQNNKVNDQSEYEILGADDSVSNDLQNIITGAPSIPKGKDLKNVILDASALAKNEKAAKAQEITNSLNKVFTEYNKEYGMDLSIDFNSLSNTLINVSDPQKRHVLELYVSEVMKSIRPILILHLIQRLSLAIDYVTQPERMFGQDISTADVFIIVEKLISYIQELEEIKNTVVISGSDLELKKLAEEHQDQELTSEESKKAVDDFMKLLRNESGIQS